MLTVITTGDHGRASVVPSGPRQFAHQYMTTENTGANPEGHEHQAWNFITYAKALGDSDAPYVLLAPELPADQGEADHLQIEMNDWLQIVETATHIPVVQR